MLLSSSCNLRIRDYFELSVNHQKTKCKSEGYGKSMSTDASTSSGRRVP